MWKPTDPSPPADAVLAQVGAEVRRRRATAGMSRRVLSEYSGVSPRYLAQLEGGSGNVSIGLLSQIAQALGVPVGALLGGAPTGEAGEIAARYLGADTATRAQVQRLLAMTPVVDTRDQRICLIGLRGAGKSTLGAGIAARFGVPFVELNAQIEARLGIPIGEIIALYGDEGFRALEAETLDQITTQHSRLVLAVAGGIVSSTATFDRVLEQFHTVWIKAEPGEHMDRVRAQGDLRPMAGNPQAMTQLRAILTQRAALYARAGHQLDTSGQSVGGSLDDLCDLLTRENILQSKDL